MDNKIRKEQIQDGGDILFGIPTASVGVTELSASGSPSSSTYLRGDNTWGTPSGSGNVDSVNEQTGVVVLDADDIDDTSTTNKFTTSDEITKLSGIEASADVTDTTNVTSAGALMDSELADISAIKTLQAPDNTTISAFGAGLIDDADASTARTTLGLVIGTNVQAYDADLTTYASITPSANVQSLLGSANYAAMRGLLDLEAGTDFYSISAANAAFQPLDSDLTTIAGLTATTDNFLVSVSSAWASRTPAQVKSTLSLNNVDNTSDTTKNAASVTLTNKRITPRVGTTTSSSTPTPSGSTNDMFTVTALAADATFAAPTGTPTDGQSLIIRVKDNGTPRNLAWNAIYRASSDLPLPTITITSKTLYCGFRYNSADTTWDLIAFLSNF